MPGETITFCASSLGRNVFVQAATGLFGGDASWGVTSYQQYDKDYQNSASFRRTVVTEDTMFQRAPVSCWYTMGQGTVRALTPSGLREWTMRLAWSVPEGLWYAARTPGQCLTFVDAGQLRQATLAPGCNVDEAVVTWSSDVSPSFGYGDMLPYMLRQRPPRSVIPGPMLIGDDGWSITMQGDPTSATFVQPEPGAHLLYIGRRGEHPVDVCSMDTDPERARAFIFAVDDVTSSMGPDVMAMTSSLQQGAQTTWTQATPWLAMGAVRLASPVVVTGMQYDWPYPADQPGTAWLLAPRDAADGTHPAPANVAAVWLVRGASVDHATATGAREGDRIAILDAATSWPTNVAEYRGGRWLDVLTPLPPNTLLLVDRLDGPYGGRAWWCGDSGGVAYNVVTMHGHLPGEKREGVRTFSDSGVPTLHVFVLLTRRADGLYAAMPLAVSSNVSNTSPSGWSWTYPLSTADGTDRFSAASLTDGLLGVPMRSVPFAPNDFACVRRRVGPRLITDPRPPEHLRVNVDMGYPVVLRAFAWALVTDGTYPTLTVHGSNDPAFFVDQNVVIPATRRALGMYSQNEHALAHGAELLWRMTFDTAGSAWTPQDVAEGSADIYLTRISEDPRYTRLYSDGTESGPAAFALHTNPLLPTAYPEYRYYALTISVGLLAGSTPRSLELQEWQPLAEAPAPAGQLSVGVYGKQPLGQGNATYKVRLSKALPLGTVAEDLGYVEVWDSFKVRRAFHQGQKWSVSSFPVQAGLAIGARRAVATLSDVLVPRYATVRSLNACVTAVPYLWCFPGPVAREGHHGLSACASPRAVPAVGPIHDHPTLARPRPMAHGYTSTAARVDESPGHAVVPARRSKLAHSGGVEVHLTRWQQQRARPCVRHRGLSAARILPGAHHG